MDSEPSSHNVRGRRSASHADHPESDPQSTEPPKDSNPPKSEEELLGLAINSQERLPTSGQVLEGLDQNSYAVPGTHGMQYNQPQLADSGSVEPVEEQDLVPDEFEEDSALGDDTGSDTTSLKESIWNYRHEHGRTYHAYKDGKYIFPNDEKESDRLDLQHNILQSTYSDKLFFAPVKHPRRCLDIGTGTGIWAMDFADQFPDCEVIGTDLSPIQPRFVPPNLQFIVEDAEDEWTFDYQFDLIHFRLMAGCFADWPGVIKRAFDALRPGAWLEIQDYGLPVRSFDGSADGTDLMKWGELLCQAGRETGRPLGDDCSNHQERWMREAGFVDVTRKMYMWPTNGWPKDSRMKELGRWNQVNITEGLEGFCLATLTRQFGWKKEEVDVFVAKIANDLANRKIHAYFPMPVTWARKPYPHEVSWDWT